LRRRLSGGCNLGNLHPEVGERGQKFAQFGAVRRRAAGQRDVEAAAPLVLRSIEALAVAIVLR